MRLGAGIFLGCKQFVDVDIDPLEGLTTFRLQTHNGDNVPRWMWQDEAMTIPVENEFDPICVREDISGNGNHSIQPDPDKQGMLVFINGVPFVWYDKIDDFYAHTASLSVPSSISCVAKNSGTGGNQTLVGFDGPGLNLMSSLGGSLGVWANAAVTNSTPNETVQVVCAAVRAANDIDLITNGVSATLINGVSFDSSITPEIGSEAGGTSNRFGGVEGAVIAAPAANAALVNSYLATIFADALGA